MASNKQIASIFLALESYYPGKFTYTPKTAEMWQIVLVDIPDNILEAATRQYMRENEWPPNGAAKIIEIAQRLMQPELPTWGEAWDECIKYINKTHKQQQEGFTHSLIEMAYKKMGGWDSLMIDDLNTARAQFRQIYEGLCSRQEKEIKMLPEVKTVSENYRLEISNLAKRLSANNG